MIVINTEKSSKRYAILLGLITLIGLALRIICCKWGTPLQLHPDEPTIIDNTIDMLSRHSWEAWVYNRPDHFEIKCNSFLFSLFSRFRYHMPAYEAYTKHKMAFYRLGRMFTAFWGAAMIPLIGLYLGRLLKGVDLKQRRITQIVAAILTAFSCIYIEHSAYATPDVVLSFFVLLFAYTVLRFLTGEKYFVYLSAGIIGISITIKYPAAILCIPLALSVIYRSIELKRPREIIKTGLLCILIVVLSSFFIAPNLYTDYRQTYETFIREARPNHLGADGLGFFGNFLYYGNQMICDQGWLSLVFFIIAIYYLLNNKSKRYLSLLVGLIYWICISVLSLHWQRWGTPVYVFYIMVSSIGVGTVYAAVDRRIEHDIQRITLVLCKCVLLCCLGLWIISSSLSAACFTTSRTLPDTRNVSLSYVIENGITASETLSEGYTPFCPGYSDPQVSSFIVSKENIKPKIEFATKKYLITTSNFKNRYLKEKDRYPQECAFYDAIDDHYDIVYQINGDNGNYKSDLSKGLVSNIKRAVSYLIKEKTYSGDIISIYDLHPAVIRLKNNAVGSYLCSESNEQITVLLSNEPYDWVLYENDNGTYSLISLSSGMAVSLLEQEGITSNLLTLTNPRNESLQWICIKKGENTYGLLSPNGMAMTYKDGMICMCEYTEGENQLWSIISPELE